MLKDKNFTDLNVFRITDHILIIMIIIKSYNILLNDSSNFTIRQFVVPFSLQKD